jgi:Helix-turn-helix domain
MRMDTPVANGDPTLAALIPEGVTLAHIIALFQDAYPVNWEQLLHARLGATHPANLAPPELTKFIKYVLEALKSAGIRDPAALLADRVRREAEAAVAKLGSSADASTPRPLAQIIANGSTKAGDERQSDKPATNIVPRTLVDPQVSTPATAAAGDEIVIGDRHLFGERRVAKMLGCSPRTLQRRRAKGKGPASTKIGRKVFYELNGLQEWIDRGKIR